MGSLGGGVLDCSAHADREPLVAAASPPRRSDGRGPLVPRGPGSRWGGTTISPGLGDFQELGAEYHAFLDRFAATDAGSLFRAQTELVHAWRRLAFLDPDLPGELLPRDWPRPSAHRLFQSRNAAWREAAQDHFSELDGSAF